MKLFKIFLIFLSFNALAGMPCATCFTTYMSPDLCVNYYVYDNKDKLEEIAKDEFIKLIELGYKPDSSVFLGDCLINKKDTK